MIPDRVPGHDPGRAGEGETRLRVMQESDIERAMEIAKALPHAPHWPREAYLTALDPSASPLRIALVVELFGSQVPKAGPGAPTPLLPLTSPFQAAFPPLSVPGVVGFAVASMIPPQAEVETIAVAAGTQRRGVGRQLLIALLEELKRRGVTEVLLEARASNLPALSLYRSAGFAPTGIRARYYADPQEDAVLMALPIL